MMNIVSDRWDVVDAAVRWLYMKKIITDFGEQRSEKGLYITTVSSKITKSEVQKVLAKHFGRQVKVVT